MTARRLTKAEIDAHHDEVERDLDRWRREREVRIGQVEGIFAATPAIRGMFHGEPRMAIKSGELSDTKSGSIRVTFFGPDGPHGHVTKRTDREAAEAVIDSMHEPFSEMADADVMEWTTTPTFERGSRIIAIIQAENTLRYLAGRVGRGDWARAVIRERGGMMFDEVPLERLDAEVDRLADAIRELPAQNPSRRVAAFARNPAWVTGALADHYELIDDHVPPRWLPQLRHVAHDRDRLVADLTEFGCGAYGCVIATHDPDVVLKVTSDETEAEFAATLANDLAAPICVTYHTVIRINARHQGAQVHLLWREAADHVGQIRTALGDDNKGFMAQNLIDRQHIVAQYAYSSLAQGHPPDIIAKRIRQWLASCEDMARQTAVPELRPLGEGLLEVWSAQHVLFGDIHAGNLGYVDRRKAWVITDPGNIAVVSDDRYW